MRWNIYHWLLDALFPRRCVGCKIIGTWCCPNCFNKLTFPRQLSCASCGTVSLVGAFCEKCSTQHLLTGLWYAQLYGNPFIRSLIKRCKYDYLTDLVEPMGQLLVTLLKTFSLPPTWHATPKNEWIITPVPLNSRKERERDFNQAELLAKHIHTHTELPIELTLQRTRATPKQSEFKNHDARRANMSGAFALIKNVQVKNKTFILIDDVYTSGATMEECARVLKTAGAREVWGLVVAKG